MSKRRMVFGTRRDYEPLIRAFEADVQVYYVQTGLFDSSDARLFQSALELPHLGVAVSGDSVIEDAFLVLPASVPLKIRDVPQIRGGTKYAIDQLENPESIVFQPGGLFKERFLVVGEVSTVGTHPRSLQLFMTMSRKIGRSFIHKGECWFGEEAHELVKSCVPCGMHPSRPWSFDQS